MLGMLYVVMGSTFVCAWFIHLPLETFRTEVAAVAGCVAKTDSMLTMNSALMAIARGLEVFFVNRVCSIVWTDLLIFSLS